MRRFRSPSAGRAHVAVWAIAVVVSGMAYSLLWGPVVLHAPVWIVPGDIWGTFRDAHLIGWGGEGILYASDIQPMTGFISLPGMPAALAPIAMFSGALNLTESLPLTLPHPTAWLLLGPVEMALGASVLFPLDALARRLGVPDRRRFALNVLEAALVWPVVAKWGHPEDLVALGLGIYALMAAQDGRWRRAAMTLGVALAFQPLVVVLVPLTLATIPWRRWVVALALVLGPALALLAAPLVHAWQTTVHVLVQQPTYPAANHPTPWMSLSTVLQRSRLVRGAVVRAVTNHSFTIHAASARSGSVVAGGPIRTIPIAASVVAAVLVRHRKTDQIVWFAASACLASRCLFEAVMTPYYAVPALAVALVLAGSWSRMRLVVAATGAATCTYLGYRTAGPWLYFLPVTVSLLMVVAAGLPESRTLPTRTEAPSERHRTAATPAEGAVVTT
jgi:hypothetical protein